MTPLETLTAQVAMIRAAGYRAVFVMTKTDETILIENLKTLLFEKWGEFERRKEYTQTPLTMWVLKW